MVLRSFGPHVLNPFDICVTAVETSSKRISNIAVAGIANLKHVCMISIFCIDFEIIQACFILSSIQIQRDRLRFTSLDEPAGDLLEFDLVLDGNIQPIVEQGPVDFLLVNVILSRHW